MDSPVHERSDDGRRRQAGGEASKASMGGVVESISDLMELGIVPGLRGAGGLEAGTAAASGVAVKVGSLAGRGFEGRLPLDVEDVRAGISTSRALAFIQRA
jgi:hypothetical protein